MRSKQDKIEPTTLRGYPKSGESMATEEITNRLKRIEGQIRGLQRMVDEQRDCEAILTQLMAARAALDRVGLLVADKFVQECILTADGTVARQRVGRVLELVFSRFSVAAVEDLSTEQALSMGSLVDTSKEE